MIISDSVIAYIVFLSTIPKNCITLHLSILNLIYFNTHSVSHYSSNVSHLGCTCKILIILVPSKKLDHLSIHSPSSRLFKQLISSSTGRDASRTLTLTFFHYRGWLVNLHVCFLSCPVTYPHKDFCLLSFKSSW